MDAGVQIHGNIGKKQQKNAQRQLLYRVKNYVRILSALQTKYNRAAAHLLK